jgi:hypothetical protein
MQSRCSPVEVIATMLGYLITLHADCYTSPINYAETSGGIEGGKESLKGERRQTGRARGRRGICPRRCAAQTHCSE